MDKFEKNLQIVMRSVKVKSSNKMLEQIYLKSQIASAVSEVKLGFFRKIFMLSSLKFNYFIENIRVQKMQLASFMMLVVIFANLTLPMFLGVAKADFTPYLESNSVFTLKRLKNKLNFLNSNLLADDKITTSSFATLHLSDFSQFRTSNDAYFEFNEFETSNSELNYNLTAIEGEYWSSLASDYNTSIELNISTPICNFKASNDSVFYFKIAKSYLYVQNFKNDLNVDCLNFNGSEFVLKQGNAFRIGFAGQFELTYNNLFILKNIELDKLLRKSSIDKYLNSKDLSLYEINKMLISLKLSNMIEISDFDRYSNQLDIIKLMYNKTLNYALKDDLSNFDENLGTLRQSIIDFKESLLNSNLDDLSKTNLYSYFIKWVSNNIQSNARFLPFEYLIKIQSDLLEVLFVYFADLIDTDLLIPYVNLLKDNYELINLKYSNSKFPVLKTLYLLKNFIDPNNQEINETINFLLNQFTSDNFISQSSSSVQTLDQNSGVNTELSSIDQDLLLESINF